MCRMLAIVSRKSAPVDTLMAFRQLADTGRNFREFGCPQPNPKSGHADGWGIACVGQVGGFYARGPGSATAGPRAEAAAWRLTRGCRPPLIYVAHPARERDGGRSLRLRRSPPSPPRPVAHAPERRIRRTPTLTPPGQAFPQDPSVGNQTRNKRARGERKKRSGVRTKG